MGYLIWVQEISRAKGYKCFDLKLKPHLCMSFLCQWLSQPCQHHCWFCQHQPSAAIRVSRKCLLIHIGGSGVSGTGELPRMWSQDQFIPILWNLYCKLQCSGVCKICQSIHPVCSVVQQVWFCCSAHCIGRLTSYRKFHKVPPIAFMPTTNRKVYVKW